MSWRDQLQPASYGNAHFHVRYDDVEIGRRLIPHEFPLRDIPYIEDSGRKLRQFSFSAYVIGPDYRAARDALIKELEKKGARTLIHPELGQMQVRAFDCRVKHKSNKRGKATFTLNFLESGEHKFPDTKPDTPAVVEEKTGICEGVFEDDFAEEFSVEGPESLFDAANDLLQDAIDIVAGISDAFPTIPTEITDFVDNVEKLSADITALIYQPAVLANKVQSLIRRVFNVVHGPLDAINFYRRMFDHGDDAPAVLGISTKGLTKSDIAALNITPTRKKQLINQMAIFKLVQRTALIEAARTASTLEFDNYTQAITLRDELNAQLEKETLTADDITYQALVDLRVALVRDIAERGLMLPRLSTYTPNATLPALVVAYQFYGDATKADEIVTRNQTMHPGFVPGGQAVEVLIDA